MGEDILAVVIKPRSMEPLSILIPCSHLCGNCTSSVGRIVMLGVVETSPPDANGVTISKGHAKSVVDSIGRKVKVTGVLAGRIHGSLSHCSGAILDPLDQIVNVLDIFCVVLRLIIVHFAGLHFRLEGAEELQRADDEVAVRRREVGERGGGGVAFHVTHCIRVEDRVKRGEQIFSRNFFS